MPASKIIAGRNVAFLTGQVRNLHSSFYSTLPKRYKYTLSFLDFRRVPLSCGGELVRGSGSSSSGTRGSDWISRRIITIEMDIVIRVRVFCLVLYKYATPKALRSRKYGSRVPNLASRVATSQLKEPRVMPDLARVTRIFNYSNNFGVEYLHCYREDGNFNTSTSLIS